LKIYPAGDARIRAVPTFAMRSRRPAVSSMSGMLADLRAAARLLSDSIDADQPEKGMNCPRSGGGGR
jgi:hypothetical protein